MRRSSDMVLVVFGCAALSLAFPPIGLWPVGFVGFVPLFRVVAEPGPRGRGFAAGLVAGFAFFLPTVYWLVRLSSNQMDNPVLMTGPLLLLVAFQSLYWGLAAAVARTIIVRGRMPRTLVLPLVWTAFEYLRSLGVLGFPWGTVGYVGVAVPATVQFASLTGLFGVTFWFALVNALVLDLVEARRVARARTVAALCLLVALALPLGHGLVVLGTAPSDRTARIAVIQPNVPGKLKWDPAFRDMSYERLERLTREAGRLGPDLIVWPETAIPTYLRTDPDRLEWVRRLAAAVDAPVLTGAPEYEVGASGEPVFRNSAFLVRPGSAELERYDKIHLVPFGEAIPFESTFPILSRVDFGEADFRPGTERTIFEARGISWSTLVCYEAIFPDLVRRFVKDGAGVLVNITNDVWYGRTSMPHQHAAMSVMRCIENRRSLARSANSGVSLLADPYGRLLARTEIMTEAFLVADLPLPGETTFYTRVGDYPGWIALGASLAGLVVAFARRRRDA